MSITRRSRAQLVASVPAVVVWGLLSTGCHRPLAVEGPTSATVEGADLEILWDAALSVLRKHSFTPARQDRAMGVIETRAETSRQWGEFWRQDIAVSETYGMAHASLHTTQRKATVRFVRNAEGWLVEVEVGVYRLSRPEAQVTTASSAIQVFSGILPTTAGQVAAGRGSAQDWVYLRRDGGLEERLLDRILLAAGM
ncbi:MAG: hypothetical protein ABII12_12930 [Planctomycetota bacterium]